LAKIKEKSSPGEGEKTVENAFNNKTTCELGRIAEYSIFTIPLQPVPKDWYRLCLDISQVL
jgi:hypothetical protein